MYGIMPLQYFSETTSYVWRHQTEEDAIKAAKELSNIANIDVIVFKIIGEINRVSIFSRHDFSETETILREEADGILGQS